MLFSSLIFLFIFLPLFFIAYFIKKDIKYKNIILLIFSLLFYAWGEPAYVFLMIISIIANYVLTYFFDKRRSKGLFIFTIIINILLLVVFKYSDFLIDSINAVLNTSIPLTKVKLPIGISFYTFQILTYVIDVWRKKVPVQMSLVNLGCYLSAFPQLIAGPIVKYETVSDDLSSRKVSLDDAEYGIKRFIIGLAKKVIIANQVAYVADAIFNNFNTSFGFTGAFIGVLAYTIQIYFDFSGYSDMAIGLGRLMGFKYLENFNYPYIANSVTDFWRRWHISLSTFFKEYVYIPLGGNRVSVLKHIRNIFIVWFLTGMWHGAAWTFIIWGLFYAVFLLLEKYVLKNILEKVPSLFKHIYVILIVMISWMIFRSNSFDNLKEICISFFGGNGLGKFVDVEYLGILQFKYILAIILGIILSFPVINYFKKIIKNNYLINIGLIILFLICMWLIVVNTYNPFIYFRF